MRVNISLHVYDVDQRLVLSRFGYTPEPNDLIDRAASYSCYEPNPNQKNPIMHFKKVKNIYFLMIVISNISKCQIPINQSLYARNKP